MSQHTRIEIWQPVSESEAKAALPTFGKPRGQLVELDTSVLSDNFRKVLTQFQAVIEAQSEPAHTFQVEEIELNLAINGKGGFALVGMMEAGMQASVKVKLKRRSE